VRLMVPPPVALHHTFYRNRGIRTLENSDFRLFYVYSNHDYRGCYIGKTHQQK